jgi:hypothetical protein
VAIQLPAVRKMVIVQALELAPIGQLQPATRGLIVPSSFRNLVCCRTSRRIEKCRLRVQVDDAVHQFQACRTWQVCSLT